MVAALNLSLLGLGSPAAGNAAAPAATGKPVAFLVAAVDNGSLPLDLYSITLSDGYSLTGTPLTGMIQLRLRLVSGWFGASRL